MFTGIVEEVGRIADVEDLRDARRIRIECDRIAPSLGDGDSVAVDGVCLTVTSRGSDCFTVDAIGTTLSRTTVGSFAQGRAVNLERALALGDRLGGHIVQGHVDGVGTVRSIARSGEHVLLDVTLPDEVREVSVLHGSIAIDGVSLTINALNDAVAQVALIPFTWDHTNLSRLQPGDTVNLEGDMLGRFVVDYLKRTGRAGVQAG